jgi:hypothetical protein
MDKLETALDDLDGLLEAHCALSDETRGGALRRSPDNLRTGRYGAARATRRQARLTTSLRCAQADVTRSRISSGTRAKIMR